MQLTISQTLALIAKQIAVAPEGLAKGAARRHLGQLTSDLTALGLSENIIVQTRVQPTEALEQALKRPSEHADDADETVVSSQVKKSYRRRPTKGG